MPHPCSPFGMEVLPMSLARNRRATLLLCGAVNFVSKKQIHMVTGRDVLLDEVGAVCGDRWKISYVRLLQSEGNVLSNLSVKITLEAKCTVFIVRPPIDDQRDKRRWATGSSLKIFRLSLVNFPRKIFEKGIDGRESKCLIWSLSSKQGNALWNLLCAIDWDPQSKIYYSKYG